MEEYPARDLVGRVYWVRHTSRRGVGAGECPVESGCFERLAAAAWPIKVFPHPGGPGRRKPLGWVNRYWAKVSACSSGYSMALRIAAIAACCPPICSQVTVGTSSNRCVSAFRSSNRSIAIRWLGSILTSSPVSARSSSSRSTVGGSGLGAPVPARTEAVHRAAFPPLSKRAHSIKAQGLDQRVRFIHQDLRPDLQVGRRNPRSTFV